VIIRNFIYISEHLVLKFSLTFSALPTSTSGRSEGEAKPLLKFDAKSIKNLKLQKKSAHFSWGRANFPEIMDAHTGSEVNSRGARLGLGDDSRCFLDDRFAGRY
jgi:hypothetical protein